MEIWDILDEHGAKTGKTIQRGKAMKQGEYFLIVDVWIMNGKGEFLVSKRMSSAQPDPDKWQPTCGCAIAGDDSISAALREVKEELGVTLEPHNGRRIKRFFAWDTAIIDVWLFQQDVDINDIVLQEEETADAAWATSAFIKHLIENDLFLNRQRVPYTDELFQICGEGRGYPSPRSRCRCI